MSVRIHALTVDCHDHERVGRFWAEVLGFGDEPKNPNTSGDPEWLLVSPDGALHLLFQQVDDSKQVKNRLHFDLQPTDRTRAEEADRLIGLGASVHAEHLRPDGSGWIVMTDPEGNEFCVLQAVDETT
jgi:predicted enzyme related to lactoylglutathione lyase